MEVSNRIRAIVKEVEFATVADIGTDHGYVPIFAVLSGKVARAIACDINKLPLEKARANVAQNGLNDKIELRLGDGLRPLGLAEVETIVIAGLGGNLLVDMLKRDETIVSSVKQLVLSPHLDLPLVRRFVHEIGFNISNETIVFDEHKYYNILNCKQGAEDIYTETEYLLGKHLINRRDEVFLSYLKDEIATIKRILKRITQGNSTSSESVAKFELMTYLLKVYQNTLGSEEEKNG